MLLFASCGLLSFCCFVLNFVLSLSSQKKTPKNGHSKNQKNKNAEKKDKQRKSVSAVVFTNSVPNFGGWATKCDFCWKPYRSRGLSTFWEGKKGPKMWKGLSWKSVQGWVENLSNYVAQHNWTDFHLNKMCFFFFLSFILIKSHFPCRKKTIFEK